jgi:pyrroloquinoline quinone (PQQ) biosynthesis protein C
MSQKIQKRYEEIMKDFSAFTEFPWEDQWSYCSWLAQTYSFVQYSTRIVTHAGALFPLSRDTFHKRFTQHSDEEKGHERLLVKDLKDFGFTLADFEVFPESKAFFQIQHYWIERVNPIALMGYILTLEGLACNYGKIATDKVLKTYNKKGSSFLRVHSAEDGDHMTKALKMLSDVTAEEEKVVLENLELSAHFYKKILQSIVAASAKNKKKHAA